MAAYDKAYSCFNQAVKLAPEFSFAAANRRVWFFWGADSCQAVLVALAQPVHALQPVSSCVVLSRAETMFQLGQRAEAIREMRSLLRRHATEPFCCTGLSPGGSGWMARLPSAHDSDHRIPQVPFLPRRACGIDRSPLGRGAGGRSRGRVVAGRRPEVQGPRLPPQGAALAARATEGHGELPGHQIDLLIEGTLPAQHQGPISPVVGCCHRQAVRAGLLACPAPLDSGVTPSTTGL